MNEAIERNWHPDFRAYTEMIVNHPNYKGLFYERAEDGRVKWVVTGKSQKGQLRQAWWDEQCRILNIPIEKGCYATAARKLHPTKVKVCQCCGKTLSILYEYPNKNLLKKINAHFGLTLNQTDCTIKDIIGQNCMNKADTLFWIDTFGLKLTKSDLDVTIAALRQKIIDLVYKDFVDKCQSPLSPGVMSNCPDRFDGFHSDGLCCREKTDKGRHADNMKTYTQDRRAYEEWADGDFNLANRLMGEFKKGSKTYVCPKCGKRRKMTADHIGPISLGFCHSTNFAPLCQSCNSSKNNRFTKSDVDKLIALENSGKTVISWHSKVIWDALKTKVKNDEDAKKLSHIMVQCHQNVLKLFSKIYTTCGTEYLERFLHPEFAFYDYRFDDFNPLHLEHLNIIKKELDSANKRKNAERYKRVAFESLDDFDDKANRKITFVIEQYEPTVQKLIALIKSKSYTKADSLLKDLIRVMSMNIKRAMWD